MVNRKVTAFVPLRSGSKSIPNKNIKEFCGKPLMYWTLSMLENVSYVEKIVVATDSAEIQKIALSFGLSKVEIYLRSDASATDTSATEEVMLEYIETSQIDSESNFLLVQATSPLTRSEHVVKGLEKYFDENYDSLLTCVRTRRFIWNEDGYPENYNYENRPRRQDFSGYLVENGAFYVNSVKNITKFKNRLSGKIGIYEMPEYTSIEIDEPHDWAYLESLMRTMDKLSSRNSIKLFLTDVDGVLTDGGMYYSENGNETKKFNTKDGMGFQILRENGIKTGILTSETTEIVRRRANKLQIDYLRQGCRGHGKLLAALEICEENNISIENVAYIGDDINCFELLSAVGIAACPSDAISEIKKIPGILKLSTKGGEGVVREFISKILE